MTSALAADIKVEIIDIGAKMHKVGLPAPFIAAAVDTAFEFEGVYDLLKMWMEEKNSAEREEIVADIQELIDDCAQHDRVDGAYVRFDDLSSIAKNIRAFKDNLRLIVDERGGIKQLAEKTGIPQPSLSRFFNSAAMPRRNTLNKIARTLGLSQVQIANEWTR